MVKHVDLRFGFVLTGKDLSFKSSSLPGRGPRGLSGVNSLSFTEKGCCSTRPDERIRIYLVNPYVIKSESYHFSIPSLSRYLHLFVLC